MEGVEPLEGTAKMSRPSLNLSVFGALSSLTGLSGLGEMMDLRKLSGLTGLNDLTVLCKKKMN